MKANTRPLRKVVDVVLSPLAQGVHADLGSYTMHQPLDLMECGHYAPAVHLRPPSKTSYVRNNGLVWRKCLECPKVTRDEFDAAKSNVLG